MIVYAATSPSGKVYIGITRRSVEYRWAAHCWRALRSDKKHPLWDAIRKYGRESFALRILAGDLTEEEAERLEIGFINLFETQDRRFGYNVSSGGRYDASAGPAAFWAAMSADPEAKAAYQAKLSEVKRSRDWSDYESMGSAARKWREQNPEDARALSLRNLAEARKVNRAKLAAGWRPTGRPLSPERIRAMHDAMRRKQADPAYRAKKSASSRRAATAQWAGRTSTEKAAVGSKISQALKARNAALTADARLARNAQLAVARANIDHGVRKARQKQALEAYWTPERRAEAGEKRWRAKPQTNDVSP